MGALGTLQDSLLDVYVNLSDWTREILEGEQEDLLDDLKTQLFMGKKSDGEDLRPYYSEDLKTLRPDGFFNSPVTAENYAVHKAGLIYPMNVNRNPDAPNLYINGRFHRELGIRFFPEGFEFFGTTPYADKIMLKYGKENFGLLDELVEENNEVVVIPMLRSKIIDLLNGKNTH